MKLFDLVFAASALGGVASALPATESKKVEPITGTVVSKGVTEDGEPYTITSDFIPLSKADLSAYADNPGNATSAVDLAKRDGPRGNCDTWNDDKYCYCSGAISTRGDAYWGSQDFCDAHKFENFRNGELYHVKWLPTMKIEYWVTNKCDHDRYVGDNCGDIFLDLIDWCEWSWTSAKGGHRDFDECLRFRFDVNGR